MAGVDLSYLALDRGIDRITYARDEVAMAMPERHEVTPPEGSAPTSLQSLLALPTLDDALLASVRPPLRQRDVLMPVRFQQAMDAALQRLQLEADAQPPRSPQELHSINRALRLLKEEAALRDLLQMYRSALFRG